MATSSSSIVSSLGAGSGIDIETLAENLVEAERKPLKDRIDEKIGKSEAAISGYGAMRSYLEQLKASFEKLNEASDFGGLTLTNSQGSALSVTQAAGAVAGNHDVQVLQLASAQRARSAGFLSASTDINGGQALTLDLTVGGASREVTVASPASLQAIATALNEDAGRNGTGLSAEVVRYSSGGITYHALELQGQTSADQGFAFSIDPASYQGATPPLLVQDTLQQAADARLRINGQTYTRSSNSISDAVANLTSNLAAVTATPARVSLSRDAQPIKDNIKALVASYNDFHEALKVLADSKSEVETLGGSLAGDRLLQTVRSQMRAVVRGSDSGTGGIAALRDLGISLELDGKMRLRDEARLDAALKNNFDNVVQMFSKSTASKTGQGLAGDAIATIDKLVSTRTADKGVIQKQIDSVTRNVQRYKDDLSRLEERLQKSLDRYMNQFSVMEAVVGESKSVRSGLTGSFQAMMSAYR